MCLTVCQTGKISFFWTVLFVAEFLSRFLSLQCGLEFWSLGFICSEGLKHPLSSPPHPLLPVLCFPLSWFFSHPCSVPCPQTPKMVKQHTQFSEKQSPSGCSWHCALQIQAWSLRSWLWTRVANSHKNCFCFLTPIAVGAETVGSSTLACCSFQHSKGPASRIWHFLLLKKLLIVG